MSPGFVLRCAGAALILLLAGCAATNRLASGSSVLVDATAGGSPPADGLQPLQSGTLAPGRVAAIPGGPLQPLSADTKAAHREVAALKPPADLWERIRRGYAIADIDTDLVQRREQWYATRPDYIARMTERSRKYLFHVVEELELRGMPTELALLPFVESAFNPQAVSSAKAAGMWQFMPATGRDFDLKQNVFRDDRRDVIASTDAALNYLQKLFNLFGDWHLALAAYNWGEGNVARAIGNNQRANRPAGYLDITMPAETRMYVPKLQALKNIVGAPRKFAAELPHIGNHPFFDTVAITHDIDVALAARLAQVDGSDFKALNPSIDRPVIMAAGTPQILLPWDNAAIFNANLRANAGKQLASWTVWQVPSTMRAEVVAQRVGMSVDDLREVNHIPVRMLIRSGSTLLVPRAGGMREDVAEQLADNGQVSLSPEVLVARRTVRARKNDSVASLARRYRISAASVADWNHVKPNARFKAGEQVSIFLPLRAALPAASVTSAKVKRKRTGKSIRLAGE